MCVGVCFFFTFCMLSLSALIWLIRLTRVRVTQQITGQSIHFRSVSCRARYHFLICSSPSCQGHLGRLGLRRPGAAREATGGRTGADQELQVSGTLGSAKVSPAAASPMDEAGIGSW